MSASVPREELDEHEAGEVGPPPARTIGQQLQIALARSADGPFVFDRSHRLRLTDLELLAGDYQRTLAEAGVSAGSTVTVQLPNTWQALALCYAAWALGAVVNPVPVIFRRRDLATILRLGEPDLLVVTARHRDTDLRAEAEDAIELSGGSTPLWSIDTTLEPRPTDAKLRFTAGSPDDRAMVMFTSGTTGVPKGVCHTHRTLLYESASIAEVFGLAGHRVFMPSPLTHITGLLYGMLMPLQTGGGVALLDRWDPAEARRIIEATGSQATVAATPFLKGLTDAYAVDDAHCSLTTFVCGGADIPSALVERAERVLGATVSRTYGSTELPTLCTVRPTDRAEVRHHTEGRPIGAARARLAPAADGVRELEVRGPELFTGYLDAAADTAAFTADGWFRTGDAAVIDDHGHITITGRIKDIIVRGGENISAKEIEDLIAAVTTVGDCAVVGLPHDTLGEQVCAVVVRSAVADHDPSLAEVVAHLDRAGIARQKFPETLVTLPALSRTPSGKVQKFLVRQQALEAVEAGIAQRRMTG